MQPPDEPGPIRIVPEQAIAGCCRRCVGERLPLNKVDVKIAVVVVIEKRDAGAHDLRHIETSGCAVRMSKAEPSFERGIAEDVR